MKESFSGTILFVLTGGAAYTLVMLSLLGISGTIEYLPDPLDW